MSRARDISRFGGNLTASDASNVPLTISAYAGQTANLVEFKNSSGSVIASVKPDGQIYEPGTVVQVKTVRTDTRTTYSSSNSGNGTTISLLNLTITPKFSNSLLIMQWMINGEMDHDNVYLIHKNGQLITTTGETGYNTDAGNSRWSGFAPSSYDTDQNSTPQNTFIQYFCNAGSVSEAVYAPAVRSSNGNNYTFHLNRTQGSTGGDSHEMTVSTGIIWEIAQ